MPDEIDAVLLRPATLLDLPAIVEIRNHYILNTHITFDVAPLTVESCRAWFNEHNDGKRYRIIVAAAGDSILAFIASGRYRAKAAYDTTVEVSIACHPDALSRGLGTRLYHALFEALAGEDIHRIVAGVAQPNDASNALHRKLGFREVGTYTEVGRKFGRYWDVLWFERLCPPERIR
jgi:phosphinothricin acetyltransferase